MNPISVCLITKNEEKHIGECLKRLRPYDWEIVVVDTGSTDGTIDIAYQYADKVCDFAWCNDFSAARNYSIEQASRPYILVLDSDEYLIKVDMPKLLALIHQYPTAIGRIFRSSHFTGNQADSMMDERVERLFPKQYYQYAYPIHEQIVLHPQSLQHLRRVYDAPIFAEHFGYQLSPAESVAKAKRNNDILLAWLEKNPDNPYVSFQIGQSYFMLDEYEKAYPYYKKSYELEHDLSREYVKTLIISFGSTLLDTNRMAEALQLLKFIQSQAYQDYADLCCLCGSILLRSNQLLGAMGEYVRALYAKTSTNQDATHNIPLYNIGLINERLGDLEEALVNYRMCTNFPLARQRIQQLTAKE
jgi:tetratricopeptide (TPR) repeat protein